MALSACRETAERCSASAVLRAYMGDLVDAIHGAEITAITMKLYSSKVISRDTRDRVRLSGLIATEKTSCLLEALESAVTTQPLVLDTFLNILDRYRPSAVIAKKMRNRLRKCCMSTDRFMCGAMLIPIRYTISNSCISSTLDHSVPLEMYCETCHQLFCQYCSITDHEAHQYGLVADVFPKHKKELERELTEVKQQLSILTTAQQAMKDRIDQISVQGKEVEQQIHTATQQAIKRLQETEKRMIEMARKEVQRKSHVVSGQIEKVASNYQQLLAFQKFVEEEVMAASPQQVLTVKHQKVEHVRSVKSKVSSSNLQPMETASIVFTADKDLLSCCSKLGKVYNLDDIQRKGKEITMVCATSTFELTSSLPQNLDALSCQLTAPGSSEPVECTITPTQSGGCSISYTPAVRGPHQMRITVGGTDIPNSPFTIHVYPTPEMRGEQIGTITPLNFPQGVAVSKSGEVVISERDCITVINKRLSKKRNFGSTGSDKGQFQSPTGIAFTHDNRLLVVDKRNHRVQMFTLEGKFIKSVGQKGKGRLQFSSPIGITVHPSSRQVFIADTDNHRIQVLNDDLTYSHEFGSKGSRNGQLNTPVDVACDSHGNVYVADSLNDRVQVFTSSGQFIDTISTHTSLLPRGIAIDSMNTVYVSDGYTVSVFDSKSQFIHCFEARYEKPNSSNVYFVGLAVDCNTGNLLQAFPGTVGIF